MKWLWRKNESKNWFSCWHLVLIRIVERELLQKPGENYKKFCFGKCFSQTISFSLDNTKAKLRIKIGFFTLKSYLRQKGWISPPLKLVFVPYSGISQVWKLQDRTNNQDLSWCDKAKKKLWYFWVWNTFQFWRPLRLYEVLPLVQYFPT